MKAMSANLIRTIDNTVDALNKHAQEVLANLWEMLRDQALPTLPGAAQVELCVEHTVPFIEGFKYGTLPPGVLHKLVDSTGRMAIVVNSTGNKPHQNCGEMFLEISHPHMSEPSICFGNQENVAYHMDPATLLLKLCICLKRYQQTTLAWTGQ